MSRVTSEVSRCAPESDRRSPQHVCSVSASVHGQVRFAGVAAIALGTTTIGSGRARVGRVAELTWARTVSARLFLCGSVQAARLTENACKSPFARGRIAAVQPPRCRPQAGSPEGKSPARPSKGRRSRPWVGGALGEAGARRVRDLVGPRRGPALAVTIATHRRALLLLDGLSKALAVRRHAMTTTGSDLSSTLV